MQRIFHAFYSLFSYGAPPRPVKAIEGEIDDLKMKLGDIYDIFKVFMRMKSKSERYLDGRLLGVYEIPSEKLSTLIRDRKEDVEVLLTSILLIAACPNTISWDNFLYMSIRFCSMSRLELSQLMFFIIVKTIKSWTLHYITSSQLSTFYSRYRKSAVESFNTQGIDFGQLPLGRYYHSDFVELCSKHSELLSPLLFLQRNFQHQLPRLRFWENTDRTFSSNRKVTLDFFLLEKTRFFLEKKNFQEAVDSLLPEAMGRRSLARQSSEIAFIAKSREIREKGNEPFKAMHAQHQSPLILRN